MGMCAYDSDHCQEPDLESSKIIEDNGSEARLGLCLLQCSLSHLASSGDLLRGSTTFI